MIEFDDLVLEFLKIANEEDVRMIMVGGGAVNFHGYQRHSADIDFWIDTSQENFDNLVITFQRLGYEVDSFPKEVVNQMQNISLKISPLLSLELITRFDVNKSFQEALKDSEENLVMEQKFWKYKVLSFDDLITSKIKAGREKDLLDIKMLTKIKEE